MAGTVKIVGTAEFVIDLDDFIRAQELDDEFLSVYDDAEDVVRNLDIHLADYTSWSSFRFQP